MMYFLSLPKFFHVLKFIETNFLIYQNKIFKKCNNSKITEIIHKLAEIYCQYNKRFNTYFL